MMKVYLKKLNKFRIGYFYNFPKKTIGISFFLCRLFYIIQLEYFTRFFSKILLFYLLLDY